MKEETALVHEFTKELLRQHHTAHVTRIESNYTQQGIPDLNVCLKGDEYWIEFKFGDNLLRPLQLAWIGAHRDAGGECFIVTKENHSNPYYIVNGRTFLHGVEVNFRFESLTQAVKFIFGE